MRRSGKSLAGVAGSVDVVVIGAGHSGLAMSRLLSLRGIDHVILERGEVANSWVTERWDSLKLLTPNWLSRLPGFRYAGPNPDGYMSMPEVIEFVKAYAEFARAPVMPGTEVTRVQPVDAGYHVQTNSGDWFARTVVIASGAFNLPLIPGISQALPKQIMQRSAQDYRRPDELEEGGVMVVGASATGLQLADEIQDSGRPVTLAVGEHVRMPRTYRGRDIQHWMHVVGLLDERFDDIDDIERARGVPSPQLVGSDDFRTLDLNALRAKGVRLAGKLAGTRGNKVQFSGSLRNTCKLADLKMNRMLDAIDDWIAECGDEQSAANAERYSPTAIDNAPCLELDLEDQRIRTVIWATGFRPDYSWLDVPVLDRKGRIRHAGGVADAPGLYVMGLPYLRRRKSSFIHGAEDDAMDLAEHLATYLNSQSAHYRSRVAV